MAREKKKPQGGGPMWANRIVRSGIRPAGEFLAHPDNYRTHPSSQEAALVGVLDKVGWVQEVIVSERTGHTLDGHLRVLAALRKGEDTPVPFKEVRVTEHEEALLLSVLDPLAAMAGHDQAKYDELVGVLPEDLFDLAQQAWPERHKETLVQFTAKEHFKVIVDCASDEAAHALHTRLTAEGYTCQLK